MGLIADHEQRRGCFGSLEQKLRQAAAERAGHAGRPVLILDDGDGQACQLGP